MPARRRFSSKEPIRARTVSPIKTVYTAPGSGFAKLQGVETRNGLPTGRNYDPGHLTDEQRAERRLALAAEARRREASGAG